MIRTKNKYAPLKAKQKMSSIYKSYLSFKHELKVIPKEDDEEADAKHVSWRTDNTKDK